MMPARRNRGFSLLEVALAVSLLVGFVGAMLALYSYAMDMREDLNRRMDVLSAQRLVLQHATNELRSAMMYPSVPFGMQGEDQQARWVCMQLPGPAAWAKRRVTEEPIPPESDIQLVGYRLGFEENEQGDVVISGLERTTQKVVSADVPEEESVEEGEEVEVVLLSPDIRYLRFRYYDGTSWAGTWRGNTLPVAVEMTLGLKPLPEDMTHEEYPYDTFRRTVYLIGSQEESRGAATGTDEDEGEPVDMENPARS